MQLILEPQRMLENSFFLRGMLKVEERIILNYNQEGVSLCGFILSAFSSFDYQHHTSERFSSPGWRPVRQS